MNKIGEHFTLSGLYHFLHNTERILDGYASSDFEGWMFPELAKIQTEIVEVMQKINREIGKVEEEVRNGVDSEV